MYDMVFNPIPEIRSRVEQVLVKVILNIVMSLCRLGEVEATGHGVKVLVHVPTGNEYSMQVLTTNRSSQSLLSNPTIY